MTSTTSTQPNTVFLGAAAGLAVVAVWVLLQLATQGHAGFNTDSVGMHWGLPIVTYDFFLLTSTGLSMVAALALIFGGDHCTPLVRRCIWLALSGLAGGVAVLALELGYPLRALWAIPTSMAFSSPLFWKVWAVIAYVVVLLLLFARVNRSGWTAAAVRGLAVALLITAMAVTGLAGMVYGAMTMRPFWSSGDVPVAFIFESLLGGVAFAIFFTYLAHGFRQDGMPERLRNLFTTLIPAVFALAIAVHLMFVGARAIVGLYGNAEGLQVWQHISASPLFHLEIWIGLVLPLVLMLGGSLRASAGVQSLAALLVMISLFIARYDYIVGGQMVPLFKGAWAPALIQYVPSVTEWALLLLAVFLANVVNAFGEKTFRLSACD